MIRNSAIVGAWVLVAMVAHGASAETRSWAAIKTKLPADTMVVIGVDVAAARTAPQYAKAIEAVIAANEDLAKPLAMMKSTCQIDPTMAVTDFTVVVDQHEKALIVIGMAGVDEAKLVACANALQAKDDPKKTITSQKLGPITRYSMTGEKDALYAAWLAKDVIAFGSDADKRTILDAALAGKAATGDLAKFIGMGNSNAMVWGAGAIHKDEFVGGFGYITLLPKETLSFIGNLTTKSPDIGKALLAEAQKALTKVIGEATKAAPAVASLLKAIKLTGKGADISASATVRLADVIAAVPLLDHIF